MENARFVRPATVAVLLFEVFPRPLTGTPASSLTVKLTTGGLLMVTPVTVTFIDSAAQLAAAASVAGAALLGMETTGVLLPGGPDGPDGPGGPAGPAGPGSPLLQAASKTAIGASVPQRTRRKIFILASRSREPG